MTMDLKSNWRKLAGFTLAFAALVFFQGRPVLRKLKKRQNHLKWNN